MARPGQPRNSRAGVLQFPGRAAGPPIIDVPPAASSGGKATPDTAFGGVTADGTAVGATTARVTVGCGGTTTAVAEAAGPPGAADGLPPSP
jgi:hypothetical protein